MSENMMRRLSYLFFVLTVDITLITAGIVLKRHYDQWAEMHALKVKAAEEQAEEDRKIVEGKCIYEYCKKDAIEGNLYCWMHTCQEPGCANPVYAFDRCEAHKAGYEDDSDFAVAECVIMGCLNPKLQGSAYCEAHRNGAFIMGGYEPVSNEEVDEQENSKEEKTLYVFRDERNIDDLDVEGFYYDYIDELDDIDDAWDYLEDNEDEWDDY